MKSYIAENKFVVQPLAHLLSCGALTLLLAGTPLGSTPSVAQAAEKAVPLTATIHYSTAVQTLDGTKWQLISPTFEGAAETPFVNFQDSRLGAGVGLNSIGGEYSTRGSKIDFKYLLSTKMAGPPELMKAETRFVKALESVQSYELQNNGKTLILRGAQTMTFRIAAVENSLANTEWELVSPMLEGAAKTPFLNFTDLGIGAGVGLNVVGGEYSATDSAINFGNLISTQMAGPPELMKAETRFLKALNETRNYELSNDGQTLILRGEQDWTFRLKGNTPQGFVQTETKIINVAPQFGSQMDGDKAPKYLQLEDLSHRVSWGKFTEAKIEGFDFEPGYRYQLRVMVERNSRTGEKRLRLMEIFSQQWMESSPLKGNHKILEVAPTEINCTGVGHTQCLQVREEDGEWRAMHAPIEGFDFQSGWRYRLQVAVTKMKHPPADSSGLRYKLVRLLDKMPVTY